MAGSSELIHRGKHYSIEFLIGLDGSVPAREFLDQFGEGNQQYRKKLRMMAQWQHFAESAPGSFTNADAFRKVRGDLFEFRAHQLRVLCFFEGRRVLLACGEQKKTDELSSAVMTRAERLRDEWRGAAPPKNRERTR